MLQILALILGLISWCMFFCCIVKRNRYSKLKKARLQIIGWFLCAVSLYIPSLSNHMEFLSKDYDSIIDCASTYHLMSIVLLAVAAILWLVLALLDKDQ